MNNPKARKCPLCKRTFILLPHDPGGQKICVFCKLDIKVYGSSKMIPIPLTKSN